MREERTGGVSAKGGGLAAGVRPPSLWRPWFGRFVRWGYAQEGPAGWDCRWSRGGCWRDAAEFPGSFPGSRRGGLVRRAGSAPRSGCVLPGLCLLSARTPGERFLLVAELKAPWHRRGLASTSPWRPFPRLRSVPSVGTAKGGRADDAGARRRFVLAYQRVWGKTGVRGECSAWKRADSARGGSGSLCLPVRLGHGARAGRLVYRQVPARRAVTFPTPPPLMLCGITQL